MIILLDTSTPVCQLTVIDGDTKNYYSWQADRSLAKGLLSFLEEKTGDIKSISGIGIMKGPGSFTGLRIGVSVSNTLADSLGIAIVGEMGEGWAEKAIWRLQNNENDFIVMPEYGAAAHITRPRK